MKTLWGKIVTSFDAKKTIFLFLEVIKTWIASSLSTILSICISTILHYLQQGCPTRARDIIPILMGYVFFKKFKRFQGKGEKLIKQHQTFPLEYSWQYLSTYSWQYLLIMNCFKCSNLTHPKYLQLCFQNFTCSAAVDCLLFYKNIFLVRDQQLSVKF